MLQRSAGATLKRPAARAFWIVLRKIGDLLLFILLAGGALYVITLLPEQKAEGPVQVIDGDSLTVDGQEIRLLGIDAPEAQQTCTDQANKEWPCGREAARVLQRLTRGAEVTCTGDGHDKYDRLLAHCTAGQLDLNGEMVRLGFAISEDQQGYVYSDRQAEARAARRGIWRGQFQTPHEWRAAREKR